MSMDVKEVGQNMLGQNFVSETRDKSALGKDDFMKLLIAQMQNQDPLAPQDSKEYLGQLAQLSSLEHLENMNDSLVGMSMAEVAGTNSQTVQYIGKKVTALGNSVTVGEDGSVKAEMNYTIPEAAASLDITITDEDGKVVRTIKKGAADLGKHTYAWDGLDEDGNPVPPGNYSFDIAAVGNEGNKVDALCSVTGEVTGITYENGYPELIMGDVKIMLGNILGVEGDVASLTTESTVPGKTVYDTYSIEKAITDRAKVLNTYNIK